MNKISWCEQDCLLRGRDCLTKTTAGRVYKVVEGCPNGDILMRTDSNEKPFVSLQSGDIWGNSMDTYTLSAIPAASLTINF